MKTPIPEIYKNGNYTCRLVQEGDHFAIYHQDGEIYEVIRKRWHSEKNKFLPGGFHRPSPAEWGVFGWTCHTLARAEEKLFELELEYELKQIAKEENQ